MSKGRRRRRCLSGGAIALSLIAALAAGAPTAGAAFDDPLFAYAPPTGSATFNGPCGVAVDSTGNFYVVGHYSRAIDEFEPPSSSGSPTYRRRALAGAGSSGNHQGPLDDPCGIAIDSGGALYVNNYHRNVVKFPSPPSLAGATVIDSDTPTGVAVDPATDEVYVDARTHVAVYDASGAQTATIGQGNLQDAFGVAVSGFAGRAGAPATDGYVYVPDAGTDTVKVFDPAASTVTPAQTISGPPGGGFASLRDSAVAVDDGTGDVYVIDSIGPAHAEQPRAVVYVFGSAGAYKGNLKYSVVHGPPSGLAVDNSTFRGRVYVTSGNTSEGGIYSYMRGSATSVLSAPTIPAAPVGGSQLFPTIPIGAAASTGAGIGCEGDACQALPSDPTDPTLTTLLSGPGNPRVRYVRHRRRAKKKRQRRKHRGHHRAGARHKNKKRRATASGASAPAAAGSGGSAASVSGGSGFAPTGQGGGASSSASSVTTAGLSPGASGFDAIAYAADGLPASKAGSHPYSLDFHVGLAGGEHLRELRLTLPPGLLLNPASGSLCTPAAFADDRSSPFESSASGESCSDFSQVGTVEVKSGSVTRRFGFFELAPAAGAAARFGAVPFGHQLVFDARIASDDSGTYLVLDAPDIPQGLAAKSLDLSLWGAPWDASHNPERGNCLNETEPDFAWCKGSIGNPNTNKPLAFLTLPTECPGPMSFDIRAVSWQQPGSPSTATDSQPVATSGCGALSFAPDPQGQLTVSKASSSSGFVFSLKNDDPGLANPRAAIRAHPKKAVVALPRDVTLNPSLGAGLIGCAPSRLAAESAFNPPGAGCPNGAKIGTVRVRSPFYDGLLDGGIYLAAPGDNPFDSLLAVYLVLKSADRGIVMRFAGELRRDPGDGTITAVFDGLPQFPYTDLTVTFRSGQRAPLVSPPRCGAAATQIAISPWSGGADHVSSSNSNISSGVDFGPCPSGPTRPFAPEAVSGGVNSNVGSYTPYYVRLSRKDTEQEITSYSLVLPKGITAKLAGIPFCPDAAIEAARQRSGAAEEASPSCPAESQVGHTLTGYGVGPALTYAGGRVYLAGPYHGSPLSLVTVNSAVVGPFDLGTIVIRSAFDIDESTAQLQIDSSASDPIPHIRDGVVLHLRDIRIYMDRFQFTHNPSSCEASRLTSSLTGSGVTFSNPADDSTASVAKHFQLLNCLTLGFKPKLGLRLRGGSRRGAFPQLRASFVSRGAKDANLKRLEVEMPHALFLAQQHIRTVCARAQFAASSCPAGSVYGKAVAYTPLFDRPLRGKVYLRASNHRFPDLVADLYSGSVHIVVVGAIGPSKQGGFRAFFDNLPDAPIERFTMTFFGGRRGLLTNSVNICKSPPPASIKGLGQNNIGSIFTSKLRGQCHKGKKHKHKPKRHRHRR